MQPDDDDSGRYRLLETVRQYGTRRLDTAGETAGLRDRHAQHYADLASRFGPLLKGPDDTMALARLVAEHDNIRAALDHFAATGQWDDYVQTVLDCELLWALIAGGEGIARLNRVLDEGTVSAPRLTARLLCVRAEATRIVLDRLPEAVADAERAVAFGEELGDDQIAGQAMTTVGVALGYADPLAGA